MDELEAAQLRYEARNRPTWLCPYCEKELNEPSDICCGECHAQENEHGTETEDNE